MRTYCVVHTWAVSVCTPSSVEIPSFQVIAILKRKWTMLLSLDYSCNKHKKGAVKVVLWGSVQRTRAHLTAVSLSMSERRPEAPTGTMRTGGRWNTFCTKETSLLLGGQNPSFQGKVGLSTFRTRDVLEICSTSCHRDTSDLGASLWLFLTPSWFFSRCRSHGPWCSLMRTGKPPCKRNGTPMVPLKPG